MRRFLRCVLSGRAKLAVVIETAALSEAELGAHCREKGLMEEPKRRIFINESVCGGCVNGFCPSFVSVIGGSLKKNRAAAQMTEFARPDSETALQQDLIDYCKSRLAGFKCPRRVILQDALPRMPNGK